MDIAIAPWAWGGPGLLVKKNDRTLLHYPDAIEATVTTDDFTARLTVRIDPKKQRPVVKRLALATRDDVDVSPALLRSLGLHKALKEIMERTASRWDLAEDGTTWQCDLVGGTPVTRFEAELAFKPETGRRVPADEVARAAEVYRAAVTAGRHDATEAVAHELGKSRSTAARRVARARELGLLGEAPRTRAGEA